jgi:chromosome partitioning protein
MEAIYQRNAECLHISGRRLYMRIISSANQKGGCGKTTTAINLSSSLAAKGQKVLLIDLDPQAHATMGLNIAPADLKVTIYDMMKPNSNGASMEEIAIDVRDNLRLVPSNARLSGLEQELSGVEGREGRLLRAIETLKTSPDYIIIDSPPSIGHLCFNALRACEEVIIPIDLSLFSLRGVSKLMEIVITLKERLCHDVRCRALITMYDYRTRYSRHVLEKVKEEFGENVFETVIRYNIRLRETVDSGLPIGEYDRHSIGHKDYEDLAEEVMRSGNANIDHIFNTLNAAESCLHKREGYGATVQGPAVSIR